MKPETGRREVPDAGCPGLYLVIQKTGTKSWAVRTRIGGKPKKITLGQFPEIDLVGARELADRYGRIVATCFVGDEDAGAWLVVQGWALAFRKW